MLHMPDVQCRQIHRIRGLPLKVEQMRTSEMVAGARQRKKVALKIRDDLYQGVFVKEQGAATGDAKHLKDRMAELEAAKMGASSGSFPMDLSATRDSMDVTAVGDETPGAQIGAVPRDVAHEWWNSQLSTCN